MREENIGLDQKPVSANPNVKPPRDTKALTLLIRNQVYILVRALAVGDFAAAMDSLKPSEGVTAEFLAERMSAYHVDHPELKTDPSARSPRHTTVQFERDLAQVEQILVDGEGHNDWSLKLEVDLSSLAQNSVSMTFISLAEVGL